jgi:hypothetical protein
MWDHSDVQIALTRGLLRICCAKPKNQGKPWPDVASDLWWS